MIDLPAALEAITGPITPRPEHRCEHRCKCEYRIDQLEQSRMFEREASDDECEAAARDAVFGRQP